MRLPGGALLTRTRARSGVRSDQPSWHLHRYTRSGDDPFSGSSLYSCRCGVVRPAF